MNRHRALVAAAVAVSGVVLVSCADDPADFQRSAERFIVGDRMAEQAGTRFHDAVCGRPSATTKGTQFGCSAADDGGNLWTFDVVIADGSEFEITGRLRG